MPGIDLGSPPHGRSSHDAPEPPAPNGLAARLGNIRRRLHLGPYRRQLSLGFRRDLTKAFDAPAARIPLALRAFRTSDLDALFPQGCDTQARRERDDTLWRQGQVARGQLASRCFVAVDERSGTPCHIQWLTQPGYGEAIRRAGALPSLAIGEAMLENAFTPSAYRGQGVLPAVVCLIGEEAAAAGTSTLVAFIDVENVPSLTGAKRAGLQPYTLRMWDQYGFGSVHRVRFMPLRPGSPYAMPNGPADAAQQL